MSIVSKTLFTCPKENNCELIELLFYPKTQTRKRIYAYVNRGNEICKYIHPHETPNEMLVRIGVCDGQ